MHRLAERATSNREAASISVRASTRMKAARPSAGAASAHQRMRRANIENRQIGENQLTTDGGRNARVHQPVAR